MYLGKLKQLIIWDGWSDVYESTEATNSIFYVYALYCWLDSRLT